MAACITQQRVRPTDCTVRQQQQLLILIGSHCNIIQRGQTTALVRCFIASLVFREINSTHNLTQTNQPSTKPCYVLVLLIILGKIKKYGHLGGSQSREFGIFKQLLRIYVMEILAYVLCSQCSVALLSIVDHAS